MQLLALGVVGIVIGRARWGLWQPWLVGVPIVLAALWGASNEVWALLPNLI
jgi:sortase A